MKPWRALSITVMLDFSNAAWQLKDKENALWADLYDEQSWAVSWRMDSSLQSLVYMGHSVLQCLGRFQK